MFKAREVCLSIVAAFIAWGFLVSWAPTLRYLGYAFAAGLVAALAIISIAMLLSTIPKVGVLDQTRHDRSSPAFTSPAAWIKESTRLAQDALYRQEVIFPPSFPISQSLDALLDTILEDLVLTWYSRISQTGAFVNEINRALRGVMIEVRKRILEQDIVEAVVARVVPVITRHLKDFYEAERAVRGINLNRTVTESEELDLAIAAKYRDGNLHPAASLRYSDLRTVQQEHLRRLVVRVLPNVLTESIIGSRAVSVLIKEIVTCAVLYPAVRMLADPDTCNRLLESYGQTLIQDRKTVNKLRAALDEHASPPPKSTKPRTALKLAIDDDERGFERFIRSIRTCNNLSEARRLRSEVSSQLKRALLADQRDQIYVRRLESGKHLLDQKIGKLSAVGNAADSNVLRNGTKLKQAHHASHNPPLRQVLYDAAGLSYFMEFMDRRHCMVMVQFWIVVDGLRNPLEDSNPASNPFETSHRAWTESERMDLAQINEAYLGQSELHVSTETLGAVQSFLAAGAMATTQQFATARASILKAQATVFQKMDEVHFPEFQKSDLYYKYLTADDSSTQVAVKLPTVTDKGPSIAITPEPIEKPQMDRSFLLAEEKAPQLRRNAASSSDLKFSARNPDLLPGGRRSLDDTAKPLFDDDVDDDQLVHSTHSFDNETSNDDHVLRNQDQMVNAMEAALNDIMTGDTKDEDAKFIPQNNIDKPLFDAHLADSPRSSGEYKRVTATSLPEKHRTESVRPNLASLGLVNTSSRIGVFSDDDLFGDEEKFLEDEQTDPDVSGEDKSLSESIHHAAPGDLGLAEAITALTTDVDRLAAQESVLDTLTRKAELTNNLAELRILGKSKSSLQREIRRKELQRQQYIVQESDNSLYGRAEVRIKSIMVGREPDGQEFALYVIEVQRQAGDSMAAASWAVARRYSEFHDLHRQLRRKYPVIRTIDFPRRGLVVKMQREFLHKRRLALEDYLQQLLHLPAVCRSRDLRAFLSQSAIINQKEPSQEGERRDIVSRIYNSVTDGMDEFLGNVPVLDQLSVAGQNLITAATSQFNTMTATTSAQSSGSPAGSISIAPEDPIQTAEARAELLVFEPDTVPNGKADQLEPFVKPICDIFLEAFDLQRGNNWLRGRAVVVVLHQLLGGTVERKVRETVRGLFAEGAVLKYISLLKETMWPDGRLRKDAPNRTSTERTKSKMAASVTLATLIPELAGNVVGRANAQAASRRLAATLNNERLNTHLVLSVVDEIVDILFPR